MLCTDPRSFPSLRPCCVPNKQTGGDGDAGAAADASLGGKHVIHADVPLASLLGYATALRSITQGEGSFSMEFSHYAPDESGQGLAQH